MGPRLSTRKPRLTSATLPPTHPLMDTQGLPLQEVIRILPVSELNLRSLPVARIQTQQHLCPIQVPPRRCLSQTQRPPSRCLIRGDQPPQSPILTQQPQYLTPTPQHLVPILTHQLQTPNTT